MAPLGLALLLFCLFTLFGKALQELVRFRSPVLRSWLIAPTVGFALIEILVCFLNQVGNLPVKAFASWVLLALLFGSAAVLWWRKPVFPSRQLAPYGVALAFSLLYTGWPALVLGFNWLSYVTNDMTYFSAGAVRMMEHPFFTPPTLQDLVGTDYTQNSWRVNVASQVRYGGEMLVAWSAGAAGLNPLQILMPLMLALQLTQMCAAGALVLARPRLRCLALLTVIVVGLSPLCALGICNVSLPQSGGIPAMLVLTLLLTIEPLGWRQAWPYCLVLSTVLAGLFLHYPEVIAFAVLSAIVFWCSRGIRERRIPRIPLGYLAASLLLVCVMIRGAVLTGIINTLGNVQNAALTGVIPTRSIFPHFLMPSGLPTLFGFLPLAQYPPEPVLSGTILIGLVLFVVVWVQAGIAIWRGHLYGCMLGLFLVVGLVFFFGANDYGLYKLAIFCQPVLAACITFLLMRTLKRWWRVAPILVLVLTAFSHTSYTATSAGLKVGGGLIEVPQVSIFGLIFKVPRVTAISDIYNMAAHGVATIVFRGSNVLYPSVARGGFVPESDEELPARLFRKRAGNGATRDFVKDKARTNQTPAPIQPVAFSLQAPVARLVAAEQRQRDVSNAERVSLRERIKSLLVLIATAASYPFRQFVILNDKLGAEVKREMHRPHSLWGSNFPGYSPQLLNAVGEPTHLLTIKGEGLFNVASRHKTFADYGMFRLVPYRDVRNWLMFIPSSRGPDYFTFRFGASFFQLERDPYRTGGFMSGVGRFFLLHVVKPAEKLRLRVSLTRSIMGNQNVTLPASASADGEFSTRLPFVGAGSAVVYSEAISPVWEDGQAYVAIDFGQPGIPFPHRKSGLMRLYNSEFLLDYRKLVGFCRNISAIPDTEYRQLRRPRKLESFPRDLLADSGLEYSGIYEDGWISDEAFVKLGAAGKGETVIVAGMVPTLGPLADGRLTLRLRVNEAPAQELTLKPGPFTLAVLVDKAEPVTTVRIRFSKRTPLPGNDGRLVSALLRSISVR